MNKEQAQKLLGVSRNARLKTAEQAYRQKCRKLQLKLIPGNPCSERTKAHDELGELVTAWKTLNTKTPNKCSQPTPAKRYSACRTTSHSSAQDLGDIWEDLFNQMPLPKPLGLAMVILTFAIVIAVLLITF